MLESYSADDDAHDHIGSQSATPSGARTPRPDLQDKRLPGIMHAYFGQVGTGSTSTSEPSSSIMNTSAEDNNKSPMMHQAQSLSLGAPPTAPSTPGTEDATDAAHLPAEHAATSPFKSELQRAKSFGYPTPPVSSASSVLHQESDSGERSSSRRRRQSEGCRRPSARRLSRLVPAARLSLSSQRHNAGLVALPGVVTDTSVEASHILPKSASPRNSTASNSPTHPHSPVSALSSCLELVKLTRGVIPPRNKSTPPHTPRANSSSGADTSAPRSSNPSLSSSTHGMDAGSSQHDEARRSDTYIELPPTRKPKGKLSMQISEGRGLKPSFDPYVVCFFEWNEYITQGPKKVQAEVERSQSRTREEMLGGVAIQRSGSDMGGRSIAIPMKSRQGSSTSIIDSRNGNRLGQQVTDPKWDIEATL